MASKNWPSFIGAGLLLVVAITQLVACDSLPADNNNDNNLKAPPTPVFAENYHVEGVLSLP